ncbi:MAG: homoserine dehydrogenase [Candidatus Puniceispirillaceae bacterium]
MSKAKSSLKIAIAGLGVVGAEVARQLINHGDELNIAAGTKMQLVAVSARDQSVDRGFNLKEIDWYDQAPQLAQRDDVDIIVEMIGGSEGVALDLARAALRSGKHLVTANKAMIAHHGTELAKLAEANAAHLSFEAAVAGGIPAVKTLREGLAGNKITRVSGILNGTCNYILSTMETTGRDFNEVLADAQRLGYAEAEPSFDIDGIDAAHKLTILAAIAFGHQPDFGAVSIQGIREVSSVDFSYANQLGFRIKLVGVAEPGLMPRMQTCLLPLGSQLAKVNGVLNAIEFHGEPVGSVLAVGPGAGGGATSSAVLSDLIDIAAGRGGLPFGRPINTLIDADAVKNGAGPDKPFYVRLMVVDQPGVLATLTGILQEHAISVEGLLQQGRAPGNVVALVMTTHETPFVNLKSALDEMENLPIVKAKPVAMPILLADTET